MSDYYPSWDTVRTRLSKLKGRRQSLREGALKYVNQVYKDQNNTERILYPRNSMIFRYNGNIRQLVQEFNDDEEILLIINKLKFNITYREFTARDISLRLQGDDDFMRMIIQQNGTNLCYASRRLQNDPTAVLAAISSNKYEAIKLTSSDDLLCNKEFMMQAMNVDGRCLQSAPQHIRDDEEVVSRAVRNRKWVLQYRYEHPTNTPLYYASPRLRDEKRIVLEAVSNCGMALKDANPRFRNDYDVVLEAVRTACHAIFHASEPLLRNIDIQVSSELQIYWNGKLRTDKLLNRQQTPPSIFPHILDRVNREPLVIYYCLKNRLDLIPSSPCHRQIDDKKLPPPASYNNSKKRKREN